MPTLTMSYRRHVSLFWTLLLLALPASPVLGDPRISEFMASNSKVLKDEDQSYEDWIEIENPDAISVDLGGWYLTDASSKLTQWRFPATNMPPHSFLVVFASAKDRRVPGAPLHTNFRLSASGGYLALVRPDGLTVASDFGAVYPPQVPNISYGYPLVTTNLTLVASNAPGRLLIPGPSTDLSSWTSPDLDVAGWLRVTNGVGFGGVVAQADYGQAVLATAPLAYWRLNEAAGAATALDAGSGTGLDASYLGSVTLGTAGPRPSAFKGFDSKNNAPTFNGSSAYAEVSQSLLNNVAAFSMGGWIKPSITPVARSGLFGQNDCVEFGFIDGATLQAWTPLGGSVNAPYGFAVNGWHHVAVVGDGNALRIYLDGQLAATGGNPTATYGASPDLFRIGGGGIFDPSANFFRGQIDEVFVHHRPLSAGEVLSLYQAGTNAVGTPTGLFVNTDVSALMSNVTASALTRFTFRVDDPSALSLVTLRMRYDDGFVAFLNGRELARANAPATLAWDAASTAPHGPGTVDEFRTGPDAMVPGTNVLSILGLNLSPIDPDFLIQAELIGTGIAQGSAVPGYLPFPTPGALNGFGTTNPGPAIVEVSHAPNVPRDDQDLVVTARVQKTFSPVDAVTLRYRVMYAAEVAVPMFDDGAHGDGAAGDGVFGAVIPASASTNGQMIRYSIRASDTRGSQSRFPVFSDPAGSAEYLGTLVDDPRVQSKLPVVHLFVDPKQQGAVDAQSGGRASVFHDGEFYDNVQMQVRGNSTAGYDKKSHRLEFNHEHPFRHPGPGGRIRKTSFTADYPDPSYMRQGLSFWLCTLMGAPAPFYYPMRLQLNTQFYQLANHNDVLGEEMLARVGYDPNGALYNAVGIAAASQYSTGGFEKKTRRWEGVDDYTALANAIAESVPAGLRQTNVFEVFDLPEVIDYLVVARWTQENDDVWANMSLYHDNDGDTLWRIVPFDMNLSWGAAFGTGDPVDNGLMITNDAHKSFPLYGGSKAIALTGPGEFNRVYDAIFAIPQTREMFLRRMRTLLDTYVGAPGTAAGTTLIEQHALAWRDLIAEEALRDRARWGWPANGGQSNFDPGIGLTNGVSDVLDKFLRIRREHFYGKHGVNDTLLPIGLSKDSNAGIPNAQPPEAAIAVHRLEFNPSSGNQDQEWICLTNPMPYAVDVSGWQVTGQVRHTFHPGTVIPGNGTLYLSPSLRAFRTRTTGPGARQGLFVQAPCDGHLSARGGSLGIVNGAGRPVSTFTYPGQPSVLQQYLRITELQYSPVVPAGLGGTPDDYEFLELSNLSTDQSLDLNGVHFTRGIEFDFTTAALRSLAPGQSVLLVRNATAARAAFGPAPLIAGQYTGLLDNHGERLTLVEGSGEEILDFTYDSGWYPITDGFGFSLVPADPRQAVDLWQVRDGWRPSGRIGGSPGVADPAPAPLVPVLVNEVLSWPDAGSPGGDAIELHNPSSTPADIGGWFVTDDFLVPRKFRIPDGTVIPPGGYRVFQESEFDAGAAPFAFSSGGDEAYLFSASAAGELTGYHQGWHFGAAEQGVTFGRHVTSDGRELFVAQAAVTLNGPNSLPRVGPVVISEIHYHPAAGPGGGDNLADEYVELLNLSPEAVPLFDTLHPTNTWRLQGGVQFAWPTNVTMAAGARLLVVHFDPAASASDTAAFRTRMGIADDLTLFGPYAGKLGNQGDLVELAKPFAADPTGVSMVSVDRVEYRDSAPWPVAADGFGMSLQRHPVEGFGDDPAHWVAAAPTPGRALPADAAPQILQQPVGASVSEGNSASFEVKVAPAPGLTFQWWLNGNAVPGATGPVLSVSFAGPSDAGDYQVAVSTPGGTVLSLPATLGVRSRPTLVMPPRAVQVRVKPDPAAAPTTNATFSVVAFSPYGSLHYQWRRDGVDLPGETGPSLTITDVKARDAGAFSVVVSDGISSAVSAPALLLPLVTPTIVAGPQNLAVAVDSPVTLSVAVAGSPLPFGVEWRRGTTLVASNTVYDYNAFLSFTATNRVTNFVYKVTIRNLALSTATVFATNVVSTLADADHDGMPDSWEALFQFNPASALDASADADGDGATNGQEFVAGTDPRDPHSVLALAASVSAAGVQLGFNAVSNRTYSVQFRDGLNAGVWQRLADVPARGSTHLETVADTAPGTNRYYRVITPRQP